MQEILAKLHLELGDDAFIAELIDYLERHASTMSLIGSKHDIEDACDCLGLAIGLEDLSDPEAGEDDEI